MIWLCPPNTPRGSPAAHDLAQTGQVRAHAEKLLGTAAADPEARDDLVKINNEQYASHI